MISFSYFKCVCGYLLLKYEWGKNMDGPAKGINTSSTLWLITSSAQKETMHEFYITDNGKPKFGIGKKNYSLITYHSSPCCKPFLMIITKQLVEEIDSLMHFTHWKELSMWRNQVYLEKFFTVYYWPQELQDVDYLS